MRQRKSEMQPSLSLSDTHARTCTHTGIRIKGAFYTVFGQEVCGSEEGGGGEAGRGSKSGYQFQFSVLTVSPRSMLLSTHGNVKS